MTLLQLQEITENHANPVILLEGRRTVLKEDRQSLTQLAYSLAHAFPHATFRTGNADGSDTLFAKGVAQVDPSRLQYVVPYAGMKKKNRIDGAVVLSLENITDQERDEVNEITSKRDKSAASMVNYVKEKPRGYVAAKAGYLLRDTLKATGAESAGFHPATAAIFYIDTSNKYAGGTGHTIKICEELNIPVATQVDWGEWF